MAKMGGLVDDQPLDLMEHRRVGLVGIATIGAARADHANGGLVAQHRAYLHGRGVGAQQLALAVRVRLEEEGVVHFARGMAGGEIQLGEIVIVGLNVRAFGDGKAHVGEDRGQLVHHLADGVNAPALNRAFAHRQGNVDGFGGEARFQRRVFQHVAPRAERFTHLVFQRVDRGAGGFAFVGRHFAKRRKQGRNRAFFAKRGQSYGFKRALVLRGGYGGKGFGFELVQIGHGDSEREAAATSKTSVNGAFATRARACRGTRLRTSLHKNKGPPMAGLDRL